MVHFSGHGGKGTAGTAKAAHSRDVIVGASGEEELQELYFQGAAGHMQFVSAEAIAQTFGAAGASVRLVVLEGRFLHRRTFAALHGAARLAVMPL